MFCGNAQTKRKGAAVNTAAFNQRPSKFPDLAARYDTSAFDNLIYDSAGRVSLLSDISGKSNVNGLVLNGVSGNYASTPDSAALSITGDIECVASKASLTSVAGGIFGTFLGKWSSSDSNRSFRFIMALSGTMRLQVSTDGTFSEGTTGYTFTSDASANLSSNSYFKWSLDLDNGLGTAVAYFFESQDGITWSQVGGDISYGSTISGIYDSPAVLTIGLSNPASPADIFGGRIGGITLKNGINGTTVFDADFTAQSKLATSFTESSANAATVTINSTGDTGARICGERDLVQLTASKQPIYLPFSGEKYGWTNGVSGNNFSTPDSASLTPAGVMKLRWYGALTDWTPPTIYVLASKDNGTNREWQFNVQVGGNLRFAYSTDGSTFVTADVTKPNFPDGAYYGVGCDYNPDTGDVTFYTSNDGEIWSVYGSPVSTAGGALADTSAALVVNSRSDGANPVLGTVKTFYLYEGTTPLASFNAQDYNSGSTFVSSATGETWTLNGGSHIVQRTGLYFDGSNDYLKSASFSLSQPENVYFVGEQVSWTANDKIIDGNSSTERMSIYQQTSTPTLGLTGGTIMVGLSSFALKTAGCLFSLFNGASSAIRYNRTSETSGNAGTQSGNALTLAAAFDGSGSANIFVSEIIIYDQTPDSINKQDRIALYAGRKWRLAI